MVPIRTVGGFVGQEKMLDPLALPLPGDPVPQLPVMPVSVPLAQGVPLFWTHQPPRPGLNAASEGRCRGGCLRQCDGRASVTRDAPPIIWATASIKGSCPYPLS